MSSPILINVAFVDWMEPVDGTGAPISGIAATLNSNLITEDPNRASYTATIVEEGSTGRYYITFTPTLAGTYYWRTKYTTPLQIFSESYLVVEDDATTIVVTAVTPSSGVSRTTLRQRISRELGDLLLCTATGAGSTTTFKDNIRLVGPDYTYSGREAYFVSGTANNIGLTRYVSSNTQSTTLVTFSVALPAATASSDVMELHNFRGQGWLVQEVHDAIDQCITDSGLSLFATDRDDIATVFDATTALVTIPSDYYAITAVLYQPSNTSLWQEIEPAQEANENGWYVNKGQQELVIGGYWRSAANGMTIRVVGYKQYAALTSDSSVTTCNTEWIIQQACAYLSRWGKERTPDGQRRNDGDRYQARADRIRDLISGVPSGQTAFV